jgi:hypothetical protein
MQGEELFVTGRLKDLIVIRGRNHYPQDVELTVEEAHPALRPGCGAAFSVEAGEDERLVVLHELERRFRGERREPAAGNEQARRGSRDRRRGLPEIDAFAPPGAIQPDPLSMVAEAVRQAITEQHQLQPFAIVLLKAGTIPKTSSGKVQRHACRKHFVEGTLDAVFEWRRRVTSSSDLAKPRGRSAPPGPLVIPSTDVSRWLLAKLAEVLRIHPREIDPEQSINRYGIDSLQAVEIQNERSRARSWRTVETKCLRRSAPPGPQAILGSPSRRSACGSSTTSIQRARTTTSPPRWRRAAACTSSRSRGP